MNTDKNPIDPRIAALLQGLRPVPERDPSDVYQGRLRFETEINEYLGSNQQTQTPVTGVWSAINQKFMEVFAMNKFALTTIAAVLVIAAILFGGATATVSAAQSALPGDALYSVKTGYEQARLQLTRQAYDQAMLNLEFAERRLDEIDSLIAEGRFGDISTAVSEFEAYVRGAINTWGILAQNDPARANALTQEIADSLSRYAQILTGMLASVPDSFANEVERAIKISEDASGTSMENEIEFEGLIESINGDLWMIAGRVIKVTDLTEIKGPYQVGDWVKVHAFLDVDGTLIAREIELDDGLDDNMNANYNDNDNDNGNVNFNDNDNDNDDDNGNLNSYDDDDYNDNGNLNSNDYDDDDSDDYDDDLNFNDNDNNDDEDDDNDSNNNSDSNDDGDDDDDDNDDNANDNDNESDNSNEDDDDDDPDNNDD